MAPNSSTLAWKIPWTEEPGGLVVHGVAQSWTRLKRLSSSYIVVHTLNVPNLSILLLLDVGAVYSSLLLRMSFTCICFMSWMGINEA